MAHLKTQATRKKPQKRLEWKISLVRGLYERGFDRDKVIHLFKFIDWIMRLPDELNLEVRQVVYDIEAEKKVQYVTSLERLASQQAMQQGIQQGMQQGEARILTRQLRRIFGELPASVETRLAEASPEDIERWADRVLTCKSLDDVFE